MLGLLKARESMDILLNQKKEYQYIANGIASHTWPSAIYVCFLDHQSFFEVPV